MIATLATFGAVLLAAVSTWFVSVDRVVFEPYIDEFFHIPQAQLYCDNRFDVWSDKITTPPGVYLVSYLLSPLLGCSITSLRLTNAICLVALFFVVHASYVERLKSNGNETGATNRLLAQHSALNIALFPPLFFFSALYYTDVPSTLSVAVFHWYLARSLRNKQIKFGQGCVQVLLGVISLWFRQTNIFWTAVFPIGQVIVHELDRGHKVLQSSMKKRVEGFGDTIYSIIKTTWKMDVIYDPPVRYAFLEDYFYTLTSIIVRSIKVLTQPKRLYDLTLALAPFLTLIGLFVSFIIWNGSVVLGDKTAHNATLNIPQLLYLWPYIVFFSWPLLLPHILIGPLMIMARISQLAHFEPLIFFRRQSFLPRLSLVVGFIFLFCLPVYFNTVVHRYNIADNRHYTLYVLKYLLNPWWVRYAVTPIYVACGWACLETRGEPIATLDTTPETRGPSNAKSSGLTSNNDRNTRRPLHAPDGISAAPISFVIIFLATTALQVCTTPLVEPRYFIIPWLMWRMHLPLYSADRPKNGPTSPYERSWTAILDSYDHRAILETVWLLFLDGVLGYIFLYRTFEWPSEPGAVQRFIW